jgi:hypothetical protein
MRCSLLTSSAVLGALLALSQGSWATLGGTIDTVHTDATHMRATRRAASQPGYDVHELTLGSGTLVREFVTPAGVVFAVTWQGPIKPDLNQLLGAHFPRLVAAGQVPHGDHRALRLQAPDLVIESSGRMRAFAGRAYLTALVPPGLSIGDLR